MNLSPTSIFFVRMENHQMLFPVSSSSAGFMWNNTQTQTQTQTDNNNNNNSSYMKMKRKKPRRPKFAFHTRSQVDVLDDGYRWRKYGQKAVKNNKFPRNYYRCSHEGCNVKKQVQRLTKDEGVVETTYEGVHSHLIDRPTDNFEHILNQMHIYPPL